MRNSTIELIEDTDPEDFGFRVKWWGDSIWMNFEAYEVSMIGEDGLKYFTKDSGFDTTPNISLAEKYLHGFIKWDGCAELTFDNHLCGLQDFKNHCDLMKYLHNRAHQLMASKTIQAQWNEDGQEQT